MSAQREGAGLTREQLRARHALTVWAKTAGKEALRENYRTLVHGFGAQVLRSGLLAAVAFARRYVDADASKLLLEGLFARHVMTVAKVRDAQADGLIEAIAALDATDYMLATREVLAAVIWFRRAAQGVGESTP